MSNPPFNGYVARFEMPIIAPPPASFQGTVADYYQQLQVQLTVTIAGPNGEFLDIALAKAPNATTTPDGTLFAMTGGFVRYYPDGAAVPSPDNLTTAAGGALVLKSWADDVLAQRRAFPPGTPPISRVYYLGVDQTLTAALLRLQTARMSEAALRASWKDQIGSAPASGTTLDQLIDQHNTRVMGGLGDVFVEPATAIGTAAPGATAETFAFSLRMANCDSPAAYVSPMPTFRGAPYYDL